MDKITVPELRKLASQKGVPGRSKMDREQLLHALYDISFGDLPQEVHSHIFGYVDPRSLARSMRVSYRVESTIADPIFLKHKAPKGLLAQSNLEDAYHIIRDVSTYMTSVLIHKNKDLDLHDPYNFQDRMFSINICSTHPIPDFTSIDNKNQKRAIQTECCAYLDSIIEGNNHDCFLICNMDFDACMRISEPLLPIARTISLILNIESVTDPYTDILLHVFANLFQDSPVMQKMVAASNIIEITWFDDLLAWVYFPGMRQRSAHNVTRERILGLIDRFPIIDIEVNVDVLAVAEGRLL